MKRILILGDINSAHTKKWVYVLLEKNFEIGIFSLSAANDEWCENAGITVFSECANEQFERALWLKLSYLKNVRALKRAISLFAPDILHAFYASSYGLLGALSGFHPFFISVLGSDMLLFPKSFIGNKILAYNLKKADLCIVSSRLLEKAAKDYSPSRLVRIPFGVDTELFKSAERKGKQGIVIGTVKALEDVYGIDVLIKAFAIISKEHPKLDIQLNIVGEGSRKVFLMDLIQKEQIENKVLFINPVPQQELPALYRSFHIAAFLSHSESFGVAVLEAQACALPVVVSKVGGLMEVTENRKTALWVEPDNAQDAAEKIYRLIINEKLRKEMGEAGRRKVINEYRLEDTKQTIWNVYSRDDEVN